MSHKNNELKGTYHLMLKNQWSVVQFLFIEGKNAGRIHQRLEEILDKEAFSETTIHT